MNWMLLAEAVGTAMNVFSQLDAGENRDRAAEFRAVQLEQQAKTERALGQLRAGEDKRQARILGSRLQALAPGSDVTTANLAADIAGRGEYEALVSLYEGESRARSLGLEAEAQRYGGSMARKASKLDVLSSVLTGASKIYQAYK